MQVNAHEAEEALASVDATMQKVRRAVVDGGTHYFFILWGIIWLFGFLGSHFFNERTAGFAWMVLTILGSTSSAVIGVVQGRRVRKANASTTSRRIGLFWLTLFAYCSLVVWIARPLDGKQSAMLIVIFAMLGWIAMGFLLSQSIIKFALLLTAVAFAGYYLLPNYFYLWMALLGGGTMIGCGLYIHFRWRRS